MIDSRSHLTTQADLDRTHKRRQLRRWLFGILVLVSLGAVLLLSYNIGSKSASSNAALDRISLYFGYSRKPITRTLRLDLCKIPNATFVECQTRTDSTDVTRPDIVSALVDNDLQTNTQDSQFPANQLSVTASNSGRTALLLTVTADPESPDDVNPGEYQGQIVIERASGPDVPLQVVVTLAARKGGVARWAIFALAVGAFAGTALKWVDNTFTPIALLRRRQRRVENILRQYKTALPRGVSGRLADIGLAISTFDSEGVAGSLDLITQNQDALIVFASGLERLSAQIREQRTLATSSSSLSWVREAVKVEEEFVASLRDKIWPWEEADKVKIAVGNAGAWLRQFSLLIRTYEVTRDDNDRQAVEHFALAIVRGGPESLEGPVPDPIPAGVAQRNVSEASASKSGLFSDAEEEEVGSPDIDRRSPALWLLDNAWWLTLVVIASAVVAFGYQSQFLEDAGFEGDTLDYFRMAAWAFAIQIAGGTVLETLGRLRASATATPAL